MTNPRVLVVNEPNAYRDTLTQFLGSTRPHLNTISEEPIDLDASLQRHKPALVLCSRLTERLMVTIPAWIVLYPDGASFAIASIRGVQRTILDLDISLLLTLVDESIASSSSRPLVEARIDLNSFK